MIYRNLLFFSPQVTLKLSGLEHQLEQVSRDKQELLVQKGKLEQAAEVRLFWKYSKTPVNLSTGINSRRFKSPLYYILVVKNHGLLELTDNSR